MERKSKDGDGVSSGFRAKVNNSLGVNRKGGAEGEDGSVEVNLLLTTLLHCFPFEPH